MKGGNVQEFVDSLSLGVEKEFEYKGAVYFAQGSISDGVWTMTLDRWDPPTDDYIWSFQAPAMEDCFNAFIEAPIFEGKKFWDVEKDIEWLSG